MRYKGPKNKLARREGVDLGLKTPGSKSHSNLLRKLSITPGQHGGGRKRRSKITDYGSQLRQSQQLKRMYGLSEKQMKSYFQKASTHKGNTADHLMRFLELRLDNIVYRLGFAPTRASARQFVTHGHISLNDRKVTIPSYQVAVGDVIGFVKAASYKIPLVEQMISKKDVSMLPYVTKEGPVGKLISAPIRDETKEQVNLQLVVEFYSR